MTTFALRTQLTFVHVSARMTAATALWEWVVDIALVTFSTLEHIVAWRQWHIRAPLMVEFHVAPAGYSVATCTVAAVTGFMYVVVPVTTVTFATTEVTEVATVVAVRASQPPVATVKPKTGYGKMIKGQRGPCVCAVTIRAVIAVPPFVDIIRLVAGDASASNTLEHIVLVTCGAAGARMHAG